MTSLFVFYFGLGSVAALAAEGGPEVCPPGEACTRATEMGSWGLIAIGLLFLLVALMPSKPGGKDGEAPKTKIPFLNMLQVRIEKETTGWRRLQWPILGIAFIALGVATLLQWR
jgi:hypothetical protein